MFGIEVGYRGPADESEAECADRRMYNRKRSSARSVAALECWPISARRDEVSIAPWSLALVLSRGVYLALGEVTKYLVSLSLRAVRVLRSSAPTAGL